MKTLEVSDEVHDKLVELAKEYFSQDDRITAKPYLFQVREQVKVYDSGGNGSVQFWYDEHHNEYYTIEDLKESFDDIPDPEETEIGELYFWHDDWFDNKKLTLSSYSYEPRYSNAFFTSKGLDEHIRINGHNYHKPDNYLNHAYRNAEMDLMVEFFKQISGND